MTLIATDDKATRGALGDSQANRHSASHRARELTRRLFAWVMITGTLISVILFAASYLITAPPPITDALRQLSIIVVGVVVVSLIQVQFLGEFYQQQSREAISPDLESVETRLVEEFRSALPELKAETIRSIDDIRSRVTEATHFMRHGIAVLSGAKTAGIVNIFPTRYEAETGRPVSKVIEEDLKAENSTVRLMGISLGDYFLDRGVLHNQLMELIAGPATRPLLKVKCLLVHPKCETLRERARWEAGPDYREDPAFFDSTTFIETDGAARIAKRLCERYRSVLEVRLYRQAPTAFVLLTSRFAFVEAYNYADRGSKVPLIQVQAGVNLYRHYESHFDRIWTVSEPISEYNPLPAAKSDRRPQS